MKKLAIMQPYLFPYIGYFQLLDAVNDYVIYDDVQFIKGGWINRNNLLIGKQKTLFTISLKDASANKLIYEIDIKDDFVKFLKTVEMAYSKAPYRDQVIDLLKKICAYNDKNLARFTGNSICLIADYLSIDTNMIYSSSLSKDTALKAQEKVIAICKELECNTYINAIGGQDLYNKMEFEKNDLNLFFLRPKVESYTQFSNEFMSNLSVIDVMMFNSPDTINKMLQNYELI